MLKDAIIRAFDKKAKRNAGKTWEYPMYWAIDLHDVIIPGTYTRNNDNLQYFSGALEVLKWLTNRNEMSIILFTSSHQSSINDILNWMDKDGIKFNYVNENPECTSNDLCCFDKKMYMDMMLEDKAGFNGDTDWHVVKETLNNLGWW